jgi:hypothetical protein
MVLSIIFEVGVRCYLVGLIRSFNLLLGGGDQWQFFFPSFVYTPTKYSCHSTVVGEIQVIILFYEASAFLLCFYFCPSTLDKQVYALQVTLVKMVNEATANIPNWGS